MDIASAQGLWDAQPGYLNTASYGLPPRPAVERLESVLDDWRTGRTSWEAWGVSAEQSRASFARMLGVEVEDVAIGTTVSQFVAMVAASLPEGSEIVVPDIEFTSATYPFLVLERRGIKVRAVPLDELADSLTPSTAAVSFSVVQSANGAVADLDRVEAAARANDVLTVVDSTQASGWFPFDGGRFDIVVCHTYKWLMSPRGSALMYVAPQLRDKLIPVDAGWYAAEDVHGSYYGTEMELARSARRFDVSPAWFSWVGTEPVLALIEGIGVENIWAHDVALANRFRDGLGLEPGDSAIVAVDVPDAAARLERAGIRAAARAGFLRAAFHIYNTNDDVDLALNALTDP
ncbi:MAG: aminotransferase class V-fold PLP-dependent enzyme [Actinomycetota bacterium]|nr:aminotransferase class V-fold PLP-dependent enzyme [Actinomycetota bacterium]